MSFDAGLKPFATSRELEFIGKLDEGYSMRSVGRHFGLAHDSVRLAMKALESRAKIRGYAPDHDYIYPVPDGFVSRGVTINYRGDGKILQSWVKSKPDETRRLEMMVEAIDAQAKILPRLKPIKAPRVTRADLANLYTFTDYHMGMLATLQEAGADWNLEIAKALLIKVFEHMVTHAPAAEVAVINLQGDFLHSDGLLPETPTNHHTLFQDGPYFAIVDATVDVIRRLVDIALMHHQRVRILTAEGNHDITGSGVWLNRLLAALYEREPRIEVVRSGVPYYVLEHGNTMLAFHHGHMKKPENLPAYFAAEHASLWGRTTKRYLHTGHNHHWKGAEYPGMKWIQHPTLAPRDGHAARHAYFSERAATVYSYHSQFGEAGSITVTPEMVQ